jgi:hypothetical protein
MARKIIDTYPLIEITVGAVAPKFTPKAMNREEAEEAQGEFLELINGLQARTRRQFDVEAKLVEDVRCEHCNATWRAEGPDFNGGCCDRDAANDPRRLERLRMLAGDCLAADLYRDDDRRGHDGHKEFADLGEAVAKWLAAGRPVESAAEVRRLADIVFDHKWGALWSDPGEYPSNAGSGPLPDRWMVDTHPNELAAEVIDLLDDMGLKPAREAA